MLLDPRRVQESHPTDSCLKFCGENSSFFSGMLSRNPLREEKRNSAKSVLNVAFQPISFHEEQDIHSAQGWQNKTGGPGGPPVQ